MKWLKNIRISLRNYFGFSRGETRGMLILTPILMLFMLSHFIVFNHWFRYPDNLENDLKVLDSITQSIEGSLVKNNYFKDSIPKKTIIPFFNPNQISREWLIRHGIQPLLATSWSNYLEKGGKFYKPKDLIKLYGMNDSIYNSLLPLINIPARRSSPTKINLNLADTVQLKKIYGIGSKLSQRIIKYRSLLGGFVNMDQLYEVYYLDSQIVDIIKKEFFISNKFMPSKINLDSATLDNLAKHPYLSFQDAKLIIAYRSQHGNIHNPEDLLRIPVFDKMKLKKLAPYLRISQE